MVCKHVWRPSNTSVQPNRWLAEGEAVRGAAAQIGNHLDQVSWMVESDTKRKRQRHPGPPVINLVSDPDCDTEFISLRKRRS